MEKSLNIWRNHHGLSSTITEGIIILESSGKNISVYGVFTKRKEN